MPNLLHIYRRYYPDEGGIEWTMRAFCEYLVRQGNEVSALVSSHAPWTIREEVHGVRVVRAGCVGTLANTPICPPMPGWIRRLRPDLIELHHAYPYGMWALKHAGFCGPLIVHYHFDISRFGKLQGLVMPLLRETLGRADAIFVNSRSYAESSPVLGDFLDRCVYLPAGVDPRRFDLTETQARRVDALRQGGHFRVLFVGRLSHYKGLEHLVAAMHGVDGHLYIIGRGPLAPKLSAQALELNLIERVHLLGRVEHDELVAQYHAADVVVLPSVSRGESFGVAQVEAMLCGRPVICSDLPGVCEVGIPGETACLVAPGDVAALREQLNRLAADEALRLGMGQAGRAHALARYDLETVSAQRWEVYRRLLSADA
jgi:glycosyltransferase involved in cell wall biosynthesis